MECGRGLEVVINLSKKMIDYMAELSFYHYLYLSFTQYWNAVESSYFMRILPLTLAYGEVILIMKMQRSTSLGTKMSQVS